ncbi:hypothetical protein TNCV_2674171 [Trichonephila clavipes]|nr:hypothetical protein TNCV_2674171 [Trichonephila clavipes]
MNKIRKTPVGLDCPTVSWEEFVEADDDNVRTDPTMADNDILDNTRAVGDKPRDFEPQSSDKNDTSDGTPQQATTPTKKFEPFNEHRRYTAGLQ